MKNGSARSEDVHRVAGEIDVLRTELGGLVGELDRRRHEATDVRLQMSRHPIVVAALATVAALVLGGAIALVVRGKRQSRRPSVRARETRRALGRLFQHPDRVAAEPTTANKIATAVGVAVATALAKRLVDRTIRPARS
ncbi:MAG TPA: hypothetical protein VF894_12000 [Anaeromyxobacter sp.]